jgi:hypothetical protein
VTHILLTAVLLAAGVVAIPLGRRYTGDFLHPAALVVTVWCLSFGLFLLYLMPFQPPAPAVVAFVLAAIGLLAAGTTLGRRLEQFTPDRAPSPPLSRARAWVWLYSVLGLLGVAWYIREVVHVFGWAGFLDAAAIRQAITTRTIPGHFLFLEFFCIAAPLLAVALSLGGTTLRRIDWIAPILCTVATWMTTERTRFFLIVLTVLFMFVLRRGPTLRWRRLFFVVAPAGILLASNFLFVDLWRKQTDTIFLPVVMSGAQAPGHAPAASPPAYNRPTVVQRTAAIYVYTTGSYAALGQLMEQPLDSTHGLHTVYPAARLLVRLGLSRVSLPPAIPPPVNIMRRPGPALQFNAYTFLYYPLMDFGPYGALAYAAVIGLLSGFAYGRLVRRPGSAVRILVGGQIATALALSIFVNKFNNAASWYILAATVAPFIAARSLASPEKPKETRTPLQPPGPDSETAMLVRPRDPGGKV